MTNAWQRLELGQLSGFKREDSRVIFEFGPTEATARLSVSVLEAGLLRVHYAPQGQFRPRRSWAIAKDDSEYAGSDFEIKEDAEVITIKTSHVTLSVRRDDGGVAFTTANGEILMQDVPGRGPQFAPSGNLESFKVLPPDEYYYGFGERTGLLNKRGYRYTCWNIDPVDHNKDHGPGADNLYQAIPFFMALRPGKGGYGLFFNNTFKTVFDIGTLHTDQFGLEADGGELDYYLIYGPEPAAIVDGYTGLTGRAPLPPRWALGYQQSRWSYYPDSRIRELAQEFRNRQIPADVFHLDIDYMRGYRVFTWDPERFPDPKQLAADLKEQGFKLVTIIDPGVKYEPGADYSVYNEGTEKNYFIKKSDGAPFIGYVWPDASVFPDFAKAEVREWWGNLHQTLLDSGVRGIWNDMNEPAISSTPFGQPGPHVEIPGDSPQGDSDEPATHAEVHNVYALLEDMATYQGLRRLHPNERPFLLTRAGYAGIQRWSAVWTGDNSSVWEHIELAMPQLMNLGLSGISFTGVDIGGFWGASSPELWARWIQLGAFSPFCRGHAAMGTPSKEPWVWGAETERVVKRYLNLRYRLLPYLYTVFEENTRTGAPFMRPLLYHFWEDRSTFQLNDQVMVGKAFMLAPVYRPGVEYRLVYLPPMAVWYNFWTGEMVTGPHLTVPTPDAVLPLFVRGGSIVPFGPLMQYTDERPLDQLTLDIYLDTNGEAAGELYEDDGISFEYEQGQSCRTYYNATTDEVGQVKLTAKREGLFQPVARTIAVRLHSSHDQLRTANLEADAGNWEINL